ncbi:unnamed protein product, partial [Rotaria sp. Silwood2]
MKPSEIEKYLKERYGRKIHGDNYADEEQIPDEITQASLLSDVKSPNSLALQIKSIIVKENDRGYIYIEAFKPNHIKAACEDIRTLNIQNLQIIPIKERFMKTSKNDLLSFSPADPIEVCEDELINLQSTIVDINGDSIRVLPKHEVFKDEILFKANEIRKYFSIGNHVKVLNVRLEGATGMIVGIDGVKAIVLSDGTKDE